MVTLQMRDKTKLPQLMKKDEQATESPSSQKN